MMEKQQKRIWFFTVAEIVILFAGLFVLFAFLYHHDNKYTAGPPYGDEGQISFTNSDLSKPILLIDGWKFYPGELLEPGETGTNERDLFIGQYSTFSHFTENNNPFGAGTYRLTLLHDGGPTLLTLEIPEIFTDYTLWIQNEIAASTGSGTSVTFLLDSSAVLTLQTQNDTHYYSGLTYPPVLGTPEVMNHLFFIRTLFYSIIFIVPLTLALFSLVLWVLRSRDLLFWHFGLLCLCFTIPCIHSFAWQFGFTGRLWYALEDAAWCLVLAQTVAIASVASSFHKTVYYRVWIRPFTLLFSALCFLYVYLVIPAYPGAVAWYGFVVEGYRIACWIYLIFCTVRGISKKDRRSFYLLGACCFLGISLCANLWDNGRFEPIYTGWQLEYAGFFLVLAFAGLMGHHNLKLIYQSEQLSLSELQNKLLRESAVQTRQNMDRVRALKHELNHHIDALDTFSEAKDYTRLNQYLGEMRKEKETLPSLYYCENYFINAILCSRLSAASNDDIEITSQVILPTEINLPDADICILLCNLLDNALEACARIPKENRRFIHLEAHMEEQLLSVFCENSSMHSEDSSGVFKTSKSFPEEHGFGINAMTQIVEKHEGALDISEAAGTFTVKILLYVPPLV